VPERYTINSPSDHSGDGSDILHQPDLIRGILEVSPFGILVLAADGQIVHANPRAEAMLGLTRQQMIEMGCNPAHWLLPDSPDEPHQPPFQTIVATGQPLRDRLTRIDLPDGRQVWLIINASPLYHPTGRVDNVVVIITDVTEQITAQRALEERTRQYHMLVERVPAIVYLSAMDASGTTLYISPQIERLLGYTPEEWLADPELWIKRLHPDDRDRVLEAFDRFIRSGEPFACEYRSVARDGRVVWVYEEAVALPPQDGAPPLHQGIVVDITARKEAEEALRETEERYRSIVQNAVVGIFRSTLTGRFITVNPAMARLFGYESPGQLIESVTDIARQLYVNPEQRSDMIETVSRDAGMHRFEAEFRRRDGAVFTGQLDLRLVRDERGQPLYLEGFLDDITERKRLEAQLRQAQKMEAMGRLAGGVAHDFNNLLTAILGYSDLILRRLDVHDPLQPEVLEIRKAAEQAAALTGQLLAFSRKQTLQPRVFNLNDVVRRVEKMLQRLIGEHIELVLDLDPALGVIRADPAQMEQVVVNLAINARDAMPRGGRLVIRTGTAQLDQSFIREHLGAQAGTYATLTVSDSGEGMDGETMSHLFEPFFTTKEQGCGTGLGLATVYGIVKQSEGYIWVDSEPGHGTTFAIYLPLVDVSPQGAVLTPTSTESAQPGSETILVVEDNALVRGLICDVLTEHGYTVLQASDGPGALEIYRQHQRPIHLLVSDVVMPGGMSGLDLARHLASVDRDLRVLLLSGYAEDAVDQYGGPPGQATFLQKPFTPDVLVRAVRAMLDQPRASV
jgi:two-component system cell cycle sensor histidine kinase/response regulator CckA